MILLQPCVGLWGNMTRKTHSHKIVFTVAGLVLVGLVILLTVPLFQTPLPQEPPVSEDRLEIVPSINCGTNFERTALSGSPGTVVLFGTELESTLKLSREIQERTKKLTPAPAFIIAVSDPNAACSRAEEFGLALNRVAVLPHDNVSVGVKRTSNGTPATIFLIDALYRKRQGYRTEEWPTLLNHLTWLVKHSRY